MSRPKPRMKSRDKPALLLCKQQLGVKSQLERDMWLFCLALSVMLCNRPWLRPVVLDCSRPALHGQKPVNHCNDKVSMHHASAESLHCSDLQATAAKA